MVNNTNYILDEAENKFLPIDIMDKHPKYVLEFLDRVIIYKRLCEEKGIHYDNDIIREDPYVKSWADSIAMGMTPNKENTYPRIAKFMNVEPFRTAVMINISPNWKGKFDIKSPAGKLCIKRFKASIEDYLSTCNRYSKWKFVIESGGDGDFLHAHIVAQINPQIEKSVLTHLNKGNHKIELMKFWDKNFKSSPTYLSGIKKGSEGVLKGKFAVQRILIRKEEILKDKLDYLIEENKPEGHKNSYDLNLVFGDY